MPPIKKAIIATRDGHCSEANPKIPCPEVHPPAYRVPKPIINPPTIISKNPCQVSKLFQLKSSTGNKPLKFDKPNDCKSLTVFGERFVGCGFSKSTPPINPPRSRPPTK